MAKSSFSSLILPSSLSSSFSTAVCAGASIFIHSSSRLHSNQSSSHISLTSLLWSLIILFIQLHSSFIMASKFLRFPTSAQKSTSTNVPRNTAADGPEIGTLTVLVDRARNLPNRKLFGKQSPYCAAQLGKVQLKTASDRRGGQTPKWSVKIRQ